MNLEPISPFFFSNPVIKAMDYVPLASSVTNFTLIARKLFNKSNEVVALPSKHKFLPLDRKDKGYARHIILLVPGLGNLFIGIYDGYRLWKEKREVKQKDKMTNETIARLKKKIADEKETPEHRTQAKIALGNKYLEFSTVDRAMILEGLKVINEAVKERGNQGPLNHFVYTCVSRLAEDNKYSLIIELMDLNEIKIQVAKNFVHYKRFSPEHLQKAVELCCSSNDPEVQKVLREQCSDFRLDEQGRKLLKYMMQNAPVDTQIAAFHSLLRPPTSLDDQAIENGLAICQNNFNKDKAKEALKMFYTSIGASRPEAQEWLARL